MQGSSGLDDDLFDFADDLLGDDPAADLEQGAKNLEELVQATTPASELEPARETAPAASTAHEARPSSTPPSDLDEDIFRFDELFNPPERAGAPPLHHADLLPDAAPARPSAEPELDAGPTARPPAEPLSQVQPEAPPAPRPEVQAAAPSASSQEQTEAAPDLSEARQSVAQALAHATAAREAILDRPSQLASTDGGWNKRMVISVAAAFLLVNVSLVLVATQLGRSMNRALDGVREDLNSISSARADVPIQVVLPPGGVAHASAGTEQAVPRTELIDIASRELGLAHQELAQGQFPGARRRLYRLLANRDRLLITTEVLAEAEFLVAESYLQEAKNRDLTEADE